MRMIALALKSAVVLPLGCMPFEEHASKNTLGCPSGRAGSESHRQKQSRLIIRFGSYAMGIDRAAAADVEKIIAASQAVRAFDRFGFGREGEYALQVEMPSSAEALCLQMRLLEALPSKPRGPISIEGPAGVVTRPLKT